MKIIIPSRKRPEMAQRLQTILPESIVCIAESEYESYRDVCNNIEPHPDNISGIAPLRQWILNHWEGPLVMIDDDVMRLYCLTDQYARVIKFDNWPAVIENAAIMADDLGANVFGFNQAWDVRKYRPMDPFRIHGWVIEQKGAKAMMINGPGGNDVIALFTNKAHADKTLLSYAAGYEVKHFGLIELKA